MHDITNAIRPAPDQLLVDIADYVTAGPPPPRKPTLPRDSA